MAKDMTRQWHASLHRLYDASDPGSCFSLNIATSAPIDPWQASNITLVGDAIHTMTPGRGVGANTALRDARLLCSKLVSARDGKLSLVEAVRDYEARMRDYAWKAVEQSLKNQGGNNPLYKPVIGRLLLAGMRSAFRVVDHAPPLKRRMTAGLLRSRGAGREED